MEKAYTIFCMQDGKTCQIFEGNKGCEEKQNRKWIQRLKLTWREMEQCHFSQACHRNLTENMAFKQKLETRNKSI